MQLTEEQRLIRETARAFAQREIAPFAAAWDRAEGAPRAVLRKMGEAGLMGVTIDPAWGGAGADFTAYVLAIEEISAARMSIFLRSLQGELQGIELRQYDCVFLCDIPLFTDREARGSLTGRARAAVPYQRPAPETDVDSM
jgi:alkylation response protein AidB-like acyl-CoA dehydrogenase